MKDLRISWLIFLKSRILPLYRALLTPWKGSQEKKRNFARREGVPPYRPVSSTGIRSYPWLKIIKFNLKFVKMGPLRLRIYFLGYFDMGISVLILPDSLDSVFGSFLRISWPNFFSKIAYYRHKGHRGQGTLGGTTRGGGCRILA